MTNHKIGRWLLVALAIVGLAFAAPVVSAHGNETTGRDAPPNDGTTAGWAAWMEAHMNEYMGPGAAEWMEAHMGVTIDEMARDMDTGGHDRGVYGQGRRC